MPNYEYQCTNCNNIFEIWQSVGEAPPHCPECGSDVKKIFHAPRVIFKGSGFYVTDMRAEKEGKSAKKSSDSPSSDSGTTDSKETKTDAKPESSTASSPPAPTTGAASSTPDKK